jgi:membrane-associated protease RseP (regulator of RpoE activity)
MSVPYNDRTRVDRNFFASNSASVMQTSKVLVWDDQSSHGDPQFIDPASGDYRVKEGSPALKMGFENFPMDQFGVKKASLKAIARTPLLPAYFLPAHATQHTKPATVDRRVAWLGALLSKLDGEGFSAYGVGKDAGGFVVSRLQADGALARAGIKNRDLILKINGRPLFTAADLSHYLAGQIEESYTLVLVRNQAQMEVTVVPDRDIQIESSSQPNGLRLAAAHSTPTAASLSSNLNTNNEPLKTLLDGQLANNFGPVFANSVYNGLYKMDLGAVLPVQAITSYTYNMNGSRGRLKLTLYASDSESDPGWDLSQYSAVGSIDTTGLRTSAFTAASLRARSDKLLGNYRWIVWAVFPVTESGGGENTSFQEFSVDLL